MQPGDEQVSDEARMLAAQARVRAAAAPQPARIRELAGRALSEEREGMSPAEIRALAAKALSQAQQVSALTTRLADLLGEQGGGSHG